MDIRRAPLRSSIKVALLTAGLTVGTAGANCICHGTLIVKKFYDANANGVRDAGEPGLAGWPMTITSVTRGIDSTRPTNIFGNAVWSTPTATDYNAFEATPLEGNWIQSAPVDGSGNPINPITGITVAYYQETRVSFGNYCTRPSGGYTLGFWSNKNGLNRLLDGGTAAPELALLSSLNLVDANGLPFNPATYTQFRTWLLGGTATNMAYMLSVQLAAMELNVEAGFVNGNLVYAPYGGTINALMAEANTSLGNNPLTFAGHAQRAYQEQLKNMLDALNNGAAVVSATPCSYTFSTY
jgi:hypothetical protein